MSTLSQTNKEFESLQKENLKMKILLVYMILMFSFAAFGSHVEKCEFNGVVTLIDQNINSESDTITVKVINSKAMEGSYVDCQSYVAEVLLVEVESLQGIFVGETVKLSYSYFNSLTPQGTKSSKSLTLID